MSTLEYRSPSTVWLPDDSPRVTDALTYKDRSVQFQISRLKRNFRWAQSDPENFQMRLDALKDQVNQCLIKYDQDRPYTYSGLTDLLQARFGWTYDRPTPAISGKLLPWTAQPFQMRDYQLAAVEALEKAGHGSISLPTGCHAAGTEILMFDGTIKKVENIKIGDKLMGPDSLPRTVLNLHRGRQEMVKIIPVKGDPFVVNKGHILSLVRTNTHKTDSPRYRKYKCYRRGSEIVNISVEDYLKESATFKHIHKLYRVGVNFKTEKRTYPIPPYILGLWLGDGHSSHSSLTSMDKEISDAWSEWGMSIGMISKKHTKLNNKASIYSLVSPFGTRRIWGKRTNPVHIALDNLNILGNKRIPHEYKTASRSDRLELLSGIINTDGSLDRGTFDYISISVELANDVAFVARSLGLAAYVKQCQKSSQNGTTGTYYRVCISGNIKEVSYRPKRKQSPDRLQKKSVNRTGFKTEILPVDDYYGFEVDSDHLYLMSDFTVTHNSGKSLVILNLFKRNPVKTLIITPFRSITNQIHADFVKHFGKKYVGIYGDGKKDFKKLVTIATAQSLARIEPGTDPYNEISKCEVMMFDESHMCVPDTMEKVCMGIAGNAPRRYFVSATQIRNDGSELLLKGIIGPIVYAKEFNDLVAEGYLKKPMFKFFNVRPYGDFSSQDAKAETRAQLYNNPNVHALASIVVNHAMKQNRQVVILLEEFRQFSLLLNHLSVPFEFVHGGASEEAKEYIPKEYWDSDTEAAIARFNSGETKVLIGTSAISTGVDLRPVGCLIYMQGGTSEIKIKQAIGRGTRITEGLKDFWVVDFIVKGSPVLERHAGVRADMYQDIGTVEFFG